MTTPPYTSGELFARVNYRPPRLQSCKFHASKFAQKSIASSWDAHIVGPSTILWQHCDGNPDSDKAIINSQQVPAWRLREGVPVHAPPTRALS